MSADTGARERPTKPLFRDRIRAALSRDPERLADFDALCQWEDELLDFTTDLVTRTDAAGVGVPPDATTTHAADGRAYNERDYIDRTIATIRQHEPNALRENWWTGAALALAGEVDRLAALAGVGEARPAEPAVAETMKGRLP